MSYIQAVDKLLRQARRTPEPTAHEIEAASNVLSRSPVHGYEGFAVKEVRLIGLYRCRVNVDDPEWNRIVTGQPEAWVIAVHEAAELDALSRANANPFDAGQWLTHFEEAHLQAVEIELRFLTAWASQIGITISEMAVEQTNPFRKQFPQSHRKVIRQLAMRLNWTEPDDADMARAEQFWQRILSVEYPDYFGEERL